MRSLSRLGLAVVTVMASGGLVMTSASSAAAVDCSHPWQDRSPGHNIVKSGMPINTGPYAECPNTGYGNGSQAFYLDCWDQNTNGVIWWHGRSSYGNGWVRESNMVYTYVRDAGNRCRA